MRFLTIVLAAAPLWMGSPMPGDPRTIGLLGEHVFLGTDRGLYRAEEEGFRPLFTRAVVRDLAPGPDRLLLATGQGVYEWRESEQQLHARPVASGAEVRAVAQSGDGSAWVATDTGLFVRRGGDPEFRRVEGLPVLDVRNVRTVGEEVWVSSPGTLWVARGGEPFTPLRRGLGAGWWELVDVVRRREVTLVAVPRGIWRMGPEPKRIELPVGEVRALTASTGGVWVATHRGVFSIGSENGSVELVSAVDASDLAADADRIWVASRQGVLSLGGSGLGAARSSTGFHQAPPAVSVMELHRAVLDHLGIGPGRFRELDARSRTAGLWPELRAGIRVERDRDYTRERDQAVSSGRLFNLRDSDRDYGRGLRFEVDLVWELDRLRSPADAIAISKERREIVELVERILDRANGVYFEREDVVARLARVGEDAEAERGALRLRERKLTATLDGWTGGRFSRSFRGKP